MSVSLWLVVVAASGMLAACSPEDRSANDSDARVAKRDVEQLLDETDSSLGHIGAHLSTSEGSFQVCEDEMHAEYAISAEWDVPPKTRIRDIRDALEAVEWEVLDEPTTDSPGSMDLERGDDFAGILLEGDVLYIDLSNGHCVDAAV